MGCRKGAETDRQESMFGASIDKRRGAVWCGVVVGVGWGGGGVGWGGGGGGGGGVSLVSTADVEVLRALVSRDASQIEARVGSGVYYCS